LDPFQAYLIYSTCALALVCLAFLAYKLRMKRMRSLADRLQALVEERTGALERLNQELQRLTATDGLTGVANRRRFDEAIDHEWRRAIRTNAPLSCIMIDIDHFKSFNDRYGHLQGDACLRQIANTLVGSVRRAGDVVARYGGEEFSVVMPATSLENAEKVAEHLRVGVEAIRIPHDASATAPYVTISLGVASMIPVQGVSPSALVASADRALYKAKRNGRNCVEMADRV
jgi:diguanylate cyclase (GGDEF)-like protein